MPWSKASLLPCSMAFSSVVQPKLGAPVPTGQVSPHLLRNTDVGQKWIRPQEFLLLLNSSGGEFSGWEKPKFLGEACSACLMSMDTLSKKL